MPFHTPAVFRREASLLILKWLLTYCNGTKPGNSSSTDTCYNIQWAVVCEIDIVLFYCRAMNEVHTVRSLRLSVQTILLLIFILKLPAVNINSLSNVFSCFPIFLGGYIFIYTV